MKIVALSLVPVHVAAVDDSSSMLTIGSQSSMASSLLAAVGNRNVTSMQSLIQELAEESLSGVGQFDKSVQDAIKKIREVFVKSIQDALQEQHKADQEHFNCFTKDCFGGCMDTYKDNIGTCENLDEYPCDGSVAGQFKFEHDGHCASGWISGHNSRVRSLEACAADCLEHDGCAFFAYAADKSSGNNCALYSTDGSCKDDDAYPDYNAYKIDARWGSANHSVDHAVCREQTLIRYKHYAEECGKLHCFEVDPITCPEPNCKCGDLSNCHRKSIGEYGTCESMAAATDCNNVDYGSWLNQTIAHYQGTYNKWETLRSNCAAAYKSFLSIDTFCDATQEKFEKCLCDRNFCEDQACGVTYENCEAGCWADYADLVKSKECLENDRKIDWSATKKIECYIDVLLHNYTKEELVEKCGSDTCINKAREEAYKACEQVCPNIDYDGFWPEVDAGTLASPEVRIFGHTKRSEESEFMLGDGSFECDVNGPNVFTKHRGGARREEEARCTEHLDLDYQTPQCMACKEPPPPVCDAEFHKFWYHQWDDHITEAHKGCPAGDCDWGPEDQQTSSDGDKMITIKIKQHSEAWAYNRCECKECEGGLPTYPGRPEGRQCGMGAHTLSPSVKKAGTMEFQEVCIQSHGDVFAPVNIDRDFCAKRVVLTHKAGYVSCRTAASGKSNWGCDSDSVGVVLANDRVVTAPVFDSVAGMTPSYSGHAHWYRMDGVNSHSQTMAWTFLEPYQFAAGSQYKLWYNEDLTGGTEGDNHGRVCYDMAFEPAETCNALAPLQFHQVCIGARDELHSQIDLPAGTCVSEIVMNHINGYVSCRSAESGNSRFGCDDDQSVNMVWTEKDHRSVIIPKVGQVEGYQGRNHHAHWYGMGNGGWSRSKKTLHMKLHQPLKVSGPLDLWYGEDLVAYTESDNHGKACYEVAVHRASSC